MEEQLNQLLSHLKGAWKYRWYAMAVSWVVVIIGWVVVYKMPDHYESSARIYVDTQSVLQPLMSGMAAPFNIDQQVAIMSRTLISRPNVERVMRMTDMDVQAKTEADRERLIKGLTENIKMGAAGGGNLYVISYANENSKLAKDVVQSLLTIFVEGGLGNKKKEAETAIEFIDEQIKAYEEKLLAAENALKEFKQKNAGLMSGNGDYVGQVTAAADAVNQAKLDLREAEQSRDSLKAQLESFDPDSGSDAEPVMASNPEIDARIVELNKKMDAMLLNFTEKHPDVISTRRLIAQLEERKKAEAKKVKPSAGNKATTNPMLQQLNVAMAEADARAAAMKARVEEYTARYNKLKSMSHAVPEVEAELTQLNRDYGINKSNYEQLLKRRETAKMSGSLSDTSELVTFRIVDPPTMPLKPTGPNRLRLFSIVMAAALAAGVALAVLINQIRPTFHNPNSLREITGRPVLGSVARIWNESELIKRKKDRVIFAGMLAGLFVAYGIVMSVVMFTGTA